MPDLTPDPLAEERRLAGQMYANRRWSKLSKAQRAAATQPARDAQFRKYLDAVPPEVTDPAERDRLARQARLADKQASQLRAIQALAEHRTARAAREAHNRAVRARRARERRARDRAARDDDPDAA